MNYPTKLALIQKEGLELFARKNADYGNAFKTYGPVGVIVRIGDKIARLQTIEKNSIAMVDDEKMRDTLIDLHNYAAMAIMLLDETEKDSVVTEPQLHYQTMNEVIKGNEMDESIMFN